MAVISRSSTPAQLESNSPRHARRLWMVVGIGGLVLAMVWLIGVQGRREALHRKPAETESIGEPVTVDGPGIISINPKSPLWQSLSVTELPEQSTQAPLLSVTGFVLARVQQGTEPIVDRWQFNSSELAATYTDWLKIGSEVEFARSQLAKTKELVAAETSYLSTQLARVEKLIVQGSAADADLLKAKAELLKAQIRGEKDTFAAESTLRTALNSKVALERGLSQAGIEPVVFSRAVENMVLVVANVPEARVSQVFDGQACEVRFYGYPDRVFPAHVESFSTLISQDRRTLRVLFELSDPDAILKPGMFGDVGLGTETREVIFVPATAVLRIGRDDYVLEDAGNDHWRITEVHLGDTQAGKVELISGLSAGARILSRGVVLLKPSVVAALAR